MTNKLLTVLFAAGMSSQAVFSADYYLKEAVTDWSVAGSYCTDAGRTVTSTTLPGSGDAVHVPPGRFVFDGDTAVGAASMTAVSNMYELVTSEGTVLAFDVPSGEAGLGCRIRKSTTVNADCIKSTIEKTGEGVLSLLATEPDKYLYAVNFDVKEGVLRLSQGTVYDQRFGSLKLAEGTELWLPCSPANSSRANFHCIMTEEGSLLTNVTTRAAGHIYSVSPVTAEVTESYIKGKVGGRARLWTTGNVRLETVENTSPLDVTVEGNKGCFYSQEAEKRKGVVLVKKLGKKGEVSSIGTGSTGILAYNYSGGGFRYIGEGETTDKTFSFYQPYQYTSSIMTYPAFFDAGPNGGITFTGKFSPAKDSNNGYGVRRLWLTGDNTEECVIKGDVSHLVDEAGTVYPVFLTKDGTGTWRLSGDPKEHVGGIAVLDGTLKFDSIYEKGFRSALGDSSVLTADDSRAVMNNEYVPYAFTLGGFTDHQAKPVFEYSGSGDAACTTRPLVLAGAGGSLKASAGQLTFSGISARDANTSPTLTLDGTGEENTAMDISDGAAGAKVNIVKEGAGTWNLAGDQTFTGDITVRQGTLAIRAPEKAKYADYKWYRLSVAQIGSDEARSSLMMIRQICLFDKDGVRQNAGLEMAGPSIGDDGILIVPETDIGPGQAYYDKSMAGHRIRIYGTTSGYGGLAQAFDGYFSGADGGRFCIQKLNSKGNTISPDPTDTSTWVRIVMRLPESANPITHFDVQGFTDKNGNLPTRILLEGSHNGFVWDEVYSNVESENLLAQMIESNQYNRWLSDGTTGTADNRPLGKGLTLVASGAPERSYFSWFRFSIAELGTGGNEAYIRQVGLYDENGRRLNVGLESAEKAPNERTTYTVAGTVPEAGEVGFDPSCAGMKVYFTYSGGFSNSFCDVYAGDPGRCRMKWYWPTGKDAYPTPSIRKTWIPMVMHLKEAVNVHHFDIELMELERLDLAPVRFMLEGSVDGVNWITMYDNTQGDPAMTSVPNKYNVWVSDGVAAGNENHSRPAGTGFNVVASYQPDEDDPTQLPQGVRAQVMPGATLLTETRHTINYLRVDQTGAGTLDGFNFASDGVLDVTFDGELPKHAVISGTYVDCEGVDNVSKWGISVNGSPTVKYQAKMSEGVINLYARGTVILFR